MSRLTGSVVVSVLLVAALGGCTGSEDECPAGDTTDCTQLPDDAQTEYITSTIVSQQPGDLPLLCTVYFGDCWGLKVRGWSWDGVKSRSTAGTQLSTEEYVVVGTFANGALTLTQAAVPVSQYDGPTVNPPPTTLGPVTVQFSAEKWRRIKHRLSNVPYVFSVNRRGQQLDLDVFIDASGLQDRLDKRYGVGAVRVLPVLQPLPAS
jgi:hypothetical protein